MNIELKSYHFYIGLVVFSFLTLLGVANDVGLSAVLTRSTILTTVISLLLVVFDSVLRYILFPPPVEEEPEVLPENEGQLLNIVLPEEDTLMREPIPQESVPQQPATQKQANAATEFKPFTPQQIDPEVERMIRNDPAKAADIIRKMGLE